MSWPYVAVGYVFPKRRAGKEHLVVGRCPNFQGHQKRLLNKWDRKLIARRLERASTSPSRPLRATRDEDTPSLEFIWRTLHTPTLWKILVVGPNLLATPPDISWFFSLSGCSPLLRFRSRFVTDVAQRIAIRLTRIDYFQRCGRAVNCFICREQCHWLQDDLMACIRFNVYCKAKKKKKALN